MLELGVGVIVLEVVTTRPDAVHHIQRLGIVGDRDAAQDALDHVDDLVRSDHHLRRAGQALLQIADVVDHVAAERAAVVILNVASIAACSSNILASEQPAVSYSGTPSHLVMSV